MVNSSNFATSSATGRLAEPADEVDSRRAALALAALTLRGGWAPEDLDEAGQMLGVIPSPQRRLILRREKARLAGEPMEEL